MQDRCLYCRRRVGLTGAQGMCPVHLAVKRTYGDPLYIQKQQERMKQVNRSIFRVRCAIAMTLRHIEKRKVSLLNQLLLLSKDVGEEVIYQLHQHAISKDEEIHRWYGQIDKHTKVIHRQFGQTQIDKKGK